MTVKHFPDHSELTSVSLELFRSSPELFHSCWNLSENSYLCTQATPMFPKHSPSIIKNLSVLPSVREYPGYGRDPPANDRQGALDDYDAPVHSRINHPWIIFEPLTWYGHPLCLLILPCPRYDRPHPMFVFYLVTDKVALLVPMKLYLNDLVIHRAAL